MRVVDTRLWVLGILFLLAAAGYASPLGVYAQEPPPELPATIYGNVSIVCQSNGSSYLAPAGLPVRAYDSSGSLVAETTTGNGTDEPSEYVLTISGYEGGVDIYVGSVYVASITVRSGDVVKLDLVVDESSAPGGVPWIRVEPAYSPEPNISWGEAPDNLGVAYYLVELLDSGGAVLESARVEGTSWSLSSSLADGSYTVRVAAVDLSCNQGPWVEQGFVVDTAAPRVVSVEPVNGSVVRGGFYANITVEEEVSLSVSVSVNGSSVSASVESLGGGAWLVSFPVGPGDGWYVAMVSLSDPAGHAVNLSLLYGVDTAAPVVEVVDAPFGSWVNASSGAVVLRVYDEVSGVDWGSVSAALNGSSLAVSVDEASGLVNASYSGLSDGWYVFSFSVSDRAGNSASLSEGFGVDTAPPLVEILEPSDGAVLDTRDVCIRARVSDELSSVEPGSVTVTVSGIGVVEASYNESSGLVEACLSLGDGSYTVTVEARDLAGNLGSASSSFTVSTGAPSIAVYSPALGSLVAGPDVLFNISVVDEGGLENVSVYVDGSLVESCGCGGATEWSFVETVSLGEGRHSLLVVAYDTGGLPSRVEGFFDVDASPPVVVLVSPGPGGEYTNSTVYCVEANVSDAYGVAYVNISLGGSVETVEGGGLVEACFSGLADGNHTVTVTAVDRVGHVSSASSWVFVDTEPPSLTVYEPADGGVYVDSPVPVEAAAADGGSGVAVLRVAAGGRVVAESVGGTLNTTVGLGEGRHTLVFIAVDRAGNVARVERSIVVDVEPPRIEIVEPVNGSVVETVNVTVAFSVADQGLGVNWSDVWLLIDGVRVSYTRAGGVASAVVSLEPGRHNVTVVASDLAGHAAEARVYFIVDLGPPVVSVEPGDGVYLRDGSVRVNVTAVDDAGLVSFTVLLDGRVLESCSDCGSSAGYLDVVELGEGRHVLRVVASDIAGRSVDARSVFYVDLTRPSVEIVEPADGSVVDTGNVCVRVRVGDNIALASAEVSVDGMLVDSFRGAGLHEACADLGEGWHLVSARAVDRAGWVSEARARLGVDLSPPRIELLEPGNGSLVGLGGAVELRLLVSDAVSGVGEVRVLVNGVEAYRGAVNGSLVVRLDAGLLRRGANTVVVEAVDAVGHAARLWLVLYGVEGSPGVVLVEPPGPVYVTNSTSVRVVAEVRDIGVPVEAMWLVVNGSRLDMRVEGLRASALLNLSDGRYRVEVHARYQGLGEVTSSVVVVVDTRPPTVEPVEPVNGSVVDTSPFMLRVKIVDTVTGVGAAWVSVNGSVVHLRPLDGGIYAANVSAAPGVLLARLVAVDEAGNALAEPLVFYVDLSPPTVEPLEPVVVAPRGGKVGVELRLTDDCLACILAGVGGANVSASGPARLETLTRDGRALLEVSVGGDSVVVVRVRDAAGREAAAKIYIVAGEPVEATVEASGVTLLGLPGRLPADAVEALLGMSCPGARLLGLLGPAEAPVAALVEAPAGGCRVELRGASEGRLRVAEAPAGFLVVAPSEPLDASSLAGAGETVMLYELVNGTWRVAVATGGVVVGGIEVLEPGRAYYIYSFGAGGAGELGAVAAVSAAAAPALALAPLPRRRRRVGGAAAAAALLLLLLAQLPASAASAEARIVSTPPGTVEAEPGGVVELRFSASYSGAYQAVAMAKLRLPEGLEPVYAKAVAGGVEQELQTALVNSTLVILVPRVEPMDKGVEVVVGLRPAEPGLYNVSWTFVAQALEQLQPLPPVVEKGYTLVKVVSTTATAPETGTATTATQPSAGQAETETTTTATATATEAPSPTATPPAQQTKPETKPGTQSPATPATGATTTGGEGGHGWLAAVAAVVVAAAAALIVARRRR